MSKRKTFRRVKVGNRGYCAGYRQQFNVQYKKIPAPQAGCTAERGQGGAAEIQPHSTGAEKGSQGL